MFNKKRSILLILLCCFTFLLTGCLKGNVTLTINDNGSADTEFLIVGAPILQGQIADIKNELQKQNMSINSYSEDNLDGFKASKHYENSESLHNIPFYSSTKGINQGIKIQRSWYYDYYTFDLFLPNTSSNSSSTQETEMQTALLSQVNFNFTLNLPAKTESNNATSITNNGKTLTWKLSLIDDNRMQAKVKVLNSKNIIITAIITIILILTFMVSFYKIHNKNQQNIPYWQVIKTTTAILLVLLIIVSIYSISTI